MHSNTSAGAYIVVRMHINTGTYSGTDLTYGMRQIVFCSTLEHRDYNIARMSLFMLVFSLLVIM